MKKFRLKKNIRDLYLNLIWYPIMHSTNEQLDISVNAQIWKSIYKLTWMSFKSAASGSVAISTRNDVHNKVRQENK